MMRAAKGVDPSVVGRVEPYAWPGGYPICCLVLTSNRFNADEGVWCPGCTNAAAWHIPEPEEHPDTLTLLMVDVYWEGAPMQCDVCGDDIESAYGDPDEEECEVSDETH